MIKKTTLFIMLITSLLFCNEKKVDLYDYSYYLRKTITGSAIANGVGASYLLYKVTTNKGNISASSFFIKLSQSIIVSNIIGGSIGAGIASKNPLLISSTNLLIHSFVTYNLNKINVGIAAIYLLTMPFQQAFLAYKFDNFLNKNSSINLNPKIHISKNEYKMGLIIRW